MKLLLLTGTALALSACGMNLDNGSQSRVEKSSLQVASDYDGVWQATNKWNAEYEKQYSAWIKSTFNDDFFTRGAYKGIKSDCADAAYIARIVFSYENKLPYAVKDQTDRRGRLITNDKRSWRGQSSYKKLVSFINWISSNVASSKSISSDTYPVKINRKYVTPGIIFSRPRITSSNWWQILVGGSTERPGHVAIVKNVLPTGRVLMIESTVPRAVRKLTETTNFVFTPKTNESGLRRWKQPKHYKGVAMEGMSKEQYSKAFLHQGSNTSNEETNPIDMINGKMRCSKLDHSCRRNKSKSSRMGWKGAVRSRLQLRVESRDEGIKFEVQNLCNMVQARIPVVKAAIKRQSQIGGCMGASDFDSYSTPSRDKKMKEAFEMLQDVAGTRSISKLKKYLNQCGEIEYAEGRSMTLTDFVKKLKKKHISSDPNVSLDARWGQSKAKSSCKQYY